MTTFADITNAPDFNALTKQQQVRRILRMCGDELTRAQIVAHFEGKISRESVEQYIKVEVAAIRREGTEISVPSGFGRSERKMLSEHHRIIGLHVLRNRRRRLMSETGYGSEFGLGSGINVGLIERGKVELSLTDLGKIAIATGKSIPELLLAPAADIEIPKPVQA